MVLMLPNVNQVLLLMARGTKSEVIVPKVASPVEPALVPCQDEASQAELCPAG